MSVIHFLCELTVTFILTHNHTYTHSLTHSSTQNKIHWKRSLIDFVVVVIIKSRCIFFHNEWTTLCTLLRISYFTFFFFFFLYDKIVQVDPQYCCFPYLLSYLSEIWEKSSLQTATFLYEKHEKYENIFNPIIKNCNYILISPPLFAFLFLLPSWP